jgi:thioredoxin 1
MSNFEPKKYDYVFDFPFIPQNNKSEQITVKHIEEVTDDSFVEKVLKSKKYVLLDCWAPWCGPCKELMPIIESISNDYENLEIYKLNVDKNDKVSQVLNVESIPSLFIIYNGNVIANKTGLMAKKDLKKWIETNIGNSKQKNIKQ